MDKGWRVGKWLVAGLLLLAGVAVFSGALRGERDGGGAGANDDGADPVASSYAYLNSEPTVLFRMAGRRSPSGAPQQIRISRQAAVNALRSGVALPVVLADGSRYQVRMERGEVGTDGNWTAVGRVQTRVGALAAVITFGRDGVFGILPQPDGRMLQITTRRGVSVIAPAGGLLPPGVTNPAAAPDYLLPTISAVASALPAHGGAPATPASGLPQRQTGQVPAASAQAVVGDATNVDVLGIYTADLVALRGSDSAAETEFTNLLAIASQAYVDSGTVVRLRLVGMQRIDYPETASNLTVLYDLTNNALPDGTNVVQLRDGLGADLVALLRPYRDGHGSCGNGWLNGGGLSPDSASEFYGYSVSNVDLCGPLVLAHELGHNLGSHHDLETESSSGAYGAYPFSFGYRQKGPTAFATVMAYSSGQPWIGYFSNPQSTVCGNSCGVAEHADNVRSINLMAPRIARFRNLPNTIAIEDAQVIETDSGDPALHAFFHVRLSSPAPVGGVRFDVASADGSATAGIDYVALSLGGQVIAEGQRSATFALQVLADNAVEPDETVLLRLTNVTGMAVFDAEAVVTILNDDPRARITGRVRFPAGSTPPADPFWLWATGADGSTGASYVEVGPPDFSYSLAAVKGARVTLQATPPSPFMPVKTALGIIRGDMQHDIDIQRGLMVSGRVQTPTGQPALTDPLYIALTENLNGVQSFHNVTAYPPDFSFSQVVAPGAWITITVTPPAPYSSQKIVDQRVIADAAYVFELQQIPSIALWGAAEIPEGPANTHGYLGFVLELSAPAPDGGVRVDVTTVDGTAKAGSDYGAYSATVEFAPGETTKHGNFEVFGDDEPEDDETLSIVASNASGAWLSSARMSIRIIDSTQRTPRDVDGDGRSEILWHSLTAQQLDWWQMQGPARYGAGAKSIDGKYHVAARGDLNGDGREDIVWRDAAYTELWLWQAKWDGGYEIHWIGAYPVGDWTLLTVADIDGDRRADLIWQSISAQQVDWWRMEGPRRIGAGAKTLPRKYRLATSGDFDGDGRVDLVWQDEARSEVWLWRARGDGYEVQWIAAHPGGDWDLTGAGDVDGDRRADLFWRSAASGQLSTWLMQGVQRLGVVSKSMPAHYRVIADGDFDGDGRIDLIVGDEARTDLWLWRAEPGGGFSTQWVGPHPSGDWTAVGTRPQEPRGEGSGGIGAYASDVDGDGRADLLWHSPALQQLDWWLMQGVTRRGAGAQWVPRKYRVAAKGDFNGDGREDLVWRDAERSELWLWQAQAGGGYAVHWIEPHPGGDWTLVGAGDIDGDRRAELVWQSVSLQQVHWWLMDGARRTGVRVQSLPGKYRLAATEDFDGDGREDLVWRDEARSEVWLWRSLGPEFQVQWIAPHPAGDWDLAGAGDVDGDGRADLLWHSVAIGQLDVWRMQSSERVGITSKLVPSKYRVMANGDLDGDGRTDLVWRDEARTELWVWRPEHAGFGVHWLAPFPSGQY